MEGCSCVTGLEQLDKAGRDAGRNFTSPENVGRRWSDLTCLESLERQQLMGTFLLPTGPAQRTGATPGDAFEVQEL